MSLAEDYRREAAAHRVHAGEHRQRAQLCDNLADLCEYDLRTTLTGTQARITEIETRMTDQLSTLIARADADEQQIETVVLGLRADKGSLQTQLDASRAALKAFQDAGGSPEQIAAAQAVVDREEAFLAAAQSAQSAPPGSVQVVDTTGGTVTTTTATAADPTAAGGPAASASGGDASGTVADQTPVPVDDTTGQPSG